MNLDVLMLSRDEGKGAQGEEGVTANSEACDVSPQSRVQTEVVRDGAQKLAGTRSSRTNDTLRKSWDFTIKVLRRH